MTVRYQGLKLLPASPVHQPLDIVNAWMIEQGDTPEVASLLQRLRDEGFCFCETELGCICCMRRQQ